MSKIIPAILTADPVELKRELVALSNVAEKVQIDVGDGIFIKQKTIGPKDLAKIDGNHFYELHLMTVNPEVELEQWLVIPKIQTVIFHFEAVADPERVIQQIKLHNYEVAMAFNPKTPVAESVKWADHVDKIVFLAVTPGKQGQSFTPELWEKIKEFKKLRPQTPVQVDGGLHEAEIKKIVALGVEELAVGSEIFQAANPAQRLQELRNILNNQH